MTRVSSSIMPPSAIPPKRALPSKEATLFRELLTLYEARQLKKAQKSADHILKKFPEHGGAFCTDLAYLLSLTLDRRQKLSV